MSNAKQLVDRFWQALEEGQLGQLEAIADADVHFKMPGIEMRGVEALRGVLSAYATAFPDMRHHVKHWIESGDTIALELEVTGTHTGPMQMPNGVVPPTGKKVVWESCDFIRISKGKVISWHGYFDSLPFLTTLGLVPNPS